MDVFLQSGVNFIVCDVGGSTIDTVLYTVSIGPTPRFYCSHLLCLCQVSKATPQLELKEKRACGCK
jgi:hypothetical protein